MKRICVAMVFLLLLGACSGNGSAGGYTWTTTVEETRAVGAAREMDAQAAAVWTAFSDGLLLHYLYDFCLGLDAAADVEAYLDERAAEQGEAVLLPLVVGSPYICPDQSDAVGDWIAGKAAAE